MNEISEIKEYAKRNSIPIVMDKGGEFICQTIRERGCKKILEIGSAIGYSSINFANISPDIYVRTMEIDIDRYSRAVDNIRNCGLEDRIKITNEDALDAKVDEEFDLIFIDAAKAQYEKFFEKYKHNLSENGVIITDNLSSTAWWKIQNLPTTTVQSSCSEKSGSSFPFSSLTRNSKPQSTTSATEFP